MQYIDEVDLHNKRVIVRCDFNVPIEHGVIMDNSRIKKSLKTINFLLAQDCSLVLLSHLGRVKTREDKINNTLESVAKELSKLLGKEVVFCDSPVGNKALNASKKLQAGDVLLLENTRYCDYPEKLESKNDLDLAKYWSAFGEVFVLDAFGSSHRAHSSVAGIAKFLPTYYGLLIKEELQGLSPMVTNVARPYSVFMGGAKVDDKLKYIKGLLPKCDYLLLGGGIANSFLYACGYDIKDSLCTSDEITLNELRELYKEYKNKIVLPIDFVFDNDQILDLGIKSIAKYMKYFENSKTIFINGTCGKFEDQRFARGTMKMFQNLDRVDAYKVAGGGDTVNAINKFKTVDSFDFISSGGGASIEYISSGQLEALQYIENNQNT